MQTIQCWSGGKNSTASIILEHIHGLLPSTIIMSEVMFDKKRGISGETPEHMEWVKNTAIPKFRSWGYDVQILHDDRDYLDVFNHIVTRSKYPKRNGCKNGFPIGKRCWINSRCKIKPIKDFIKSIKEPFIQYVGIAADESKRLERLEGTNRTSLLARYGCTEKMAFDLCKEYGLLSPIYKYSKRGGCWFCPNASYRELAHVKQFYPQLWAELGKLGKEKNLYSWGFKYGLTVEQVGTKVDKYIERQRQESKQISLFDEEGE